VSAPRCNRPLTVAELTEYWLGDLAQTQQSAIEEHIFACSGCSRLLEEIVALGGSLRTMARTGQVAAILAPAFIERLRTDGVRIREYSLQPGGSVNCSVAPTDDLTIAHLHAPLEGVRRLDLVLDISEGGLPPSRLADVAFNPAAGELVLAPRMSDLRRLGTVTQRVRLLSVGESGEQVIAEYVFNHSPHPGSG
jgi:hypothetical protein